MFLFDGPAQAPLTVLLAHGAGGPMDSPSLDASAKAIAATGFRVARFEFGYMASRRISNRKAPPPKAESLKAEYAEAIGALDAKGPLVIGGKSMGGRVASMIADELAASRKIVGLLCLGYPFHPIGKPEQLRTGHLVDLRTPTLIVQGTRDPFGSAKEVAAYSLSKAIEILWLEDGDHDLRPRKAFSGFSAADHLHTMADHFAAWARGLLSRKHG
jgi:uncharacterized protein